MRFEKPAPLPKSHTQAPTCESRYKFSVTASVPHLPPCSCHDGHPLNCKLPVDSLLYKLPWSWCLITAVEELPRRLHMFIYLCGESARYCACGEAGDNLPKLILSSYHVDLEDQTQVSRLSSRCLYLLSHLAHNFRRGHSIFTRT